MKFETIASFTLAVPTTDGGVKLPGAPVAAEVATSFGSNNDLRFIAKEQGVAGNGYTVEYRDPNANNATLAVRFEKSTKRLIVDLATDGAGVITTTAQELLDAIQADISVYRSVLVEAVGIITDPVEALASTAFSGGVDATFPLADPSITGVIFSVASDEDPVLFRTDGGTPVAGAAGIPIASGDTYDKLMVLFPKTNVLDQLRALRVIASGEGGATISGEFYAARA